jgi:hypothetical protein
MVAADGHAPRAQILSQAFQRRGEITLEQKLVMDPKFELDAWKAAVFSMRFCFVNIMHGFSPLTAL